MTDKPNPTETTGEARETQLPASVREGLQDAMIPFATPEPVADSTDAADLRPISNRLAEADVIGLGECTHGTRECCQMRHRLIRHLVLEHGVRAIALESNLPETMALHDFVVHGAGTAREALAEISYGPWNVDSVLEIVRWLRAFNADRRLGDRVALYGFGGHLTQGAIERLRDHFETVDQDVLEGVADDLTMVDDADGLSSSTVDVDDWQAATERVVRRLGTHLAKHRDTHKAATSERAWIWAQRYVTVLEQVLHKSQTLDGFEGDLQDPVAYLERMQAGGLPGQTMAENVAWIREDGDVDTLVLWASDAHVNRTSFSLPGIDAEAPSLGKMLADRHGEDYFAVGFSLARGSFLAMHETDDGNFEVGPVHFDGPLPDTMDAALHELGDAPLFLDIRSALRDDRTADWLAEPRRQFRTGGTYDPDEPEAHLVEYVYADAFDGLCFVEETSPTRPLDPP